MSILIAPVTMELLALAPAENVGDERLCRVVEREVAMHRERRGMIARRLRRHAAVAGQLVEAVLDPRSFGDVQPVAHVAVTRLLEGGQAGRGDVNDRGAHERRLGPVNHRPALEILRLPGEIVEKRVPGELERGRLRVERRHLGPREDRDQKRND